MTAIPFAKMNGIGNSILVVDVRGTGVSLNGAVARAIGSEPGLHFDQLMALNDAVGHGADAFIDIYNIDGTQAGACGNGTRCVAWALLRNSNRTETLLETAAGPLRATRLGATSFAVDMGEPRFAWRDIPLRDLVSDTSRMTWQGPSSAGLPPVFSAVSMGNPHAVFFVPDTDAIALDVVGPAVERHALFPDRANVSFAQIIARDAIKLRVWERGAGATLACGSAACATVVSAVRAGLTDREVRVRLPGGDLLIAWRTPDSHVIMTGDVTLEHEGVLAERLLDAAA